MGECQSIRGQWGGICPDCGQQLPNPKPAESWMHAREPSDGNTAGSSAGLGARPITGAPKARKPLEASRIQITRRPTTGYQPSARAAQMLEAVRRHDGNRSAAARELGVTQPAVGQCMDRLARHGIAVPVTSLERLRSTT